MIVSVWHAVDEQIGCPLFCSMPLSRPCLSQTKIALRLCPPTMLLSLEDLNHEGLVRNEHNGCEVYITTVFWLHFCCRPPSEFKSNTKYNNTVEVSS